ncbi:MAG: protein kinase [Rhodothermaceae bacterium]|nr:protein kinase [Rhodothermaceae bacterium]
MDRTLWDELAPLFEQAIDLKAAERRVFLDEIKSRDINLWSELCSLLDNSDAAIPFLDDVRRVVQPSPDAITKINVIDPYRLVGTQVSRYKIDAVLGRGGMGVVYKAHDAELQRDVALKFLPPIHSEDSRARERFTQEARAASGLDHPNVCTIHEIGRSDRGQIFIAMSYYQGHTLSAIVKKGPQPLEKAIDFSRQIASGLQAAHANNIVHRDIKPGNIIVTTNDVVKILDFGIAKMNDQKLTQTGATLGTVGYMSPERVRGNDSGPAGDIWALGVLMYQLLSGKAPFEGPIHEAVMYSIMYEEPDYEALPADTPDYVKDIIRRCLEKEVEQRYASMSEVLEDIDAPGRAARPAIRRNSSQLSKVTNWKTYATAGALLLAALTWILQSQVINPQPSIAASEQRIALLPFTSMPVENEETAALASGLMHVLAGMLTRFDSQENPVWVIPVSQVNRYNVDSPEKAAEMLGANVALEGMLQGKSGDLDLTLDLVDTNNPRLLGSTKFKSEEVSASTDATIQDKLLEKLASLLGVEYDSELIEKVGVQVPDDPDALAFYLQGVGYLQRYDKEGYIDFAIQQFTQSINEDSLYAPSHAGLCEARWEKFRRTKDPSLVDLALQSCDKALALGQDKATALIPLASVYLRTGSTDQAEAALRTALEIEPDNAEAYRWLGRVFEERVMLDSAQANYQRAIDMKPNNWVYYNEMGMMHSEYGNPQEAIKNFEFAKKLTPDNYIAYNSIAFNLVTLNQTEEAEESFQQALRLRPTAIEPRRNLGILYFRELNMDSAIDILIPAANEDDLMSLLYLGHAYYWSDQHDLAQSTWTKTVDVSTIVLEADPTNYVALTVLADAHAALNNTAQSLSILQQLQGKTQIGWISYLSGRVYERANDRENALRSLEQALEQNFDIYLIDKDPWLEALHTDPAYQALREAYVN